MLLSVLNKCYMKYSEKQNKIVCFKPYLDTLVLERSMKSGSLALRDVDISIHLEMRECVSDLTLAEIGVHGNILRGHDCA
jgi:hypothetical protein